MADGGPPTTPAPQARPAPQPPLIVPPVPLVQPPVPPAQPIPIQPNQPASCTTINVVTIQTRIHR